MLLTIFHLKSLDSVDRLTCIRNIQNPILIIQLLNSIIEAVLQRILQVNKEFSIKLTFFNRLMQWSVRLNLDQCQLSSELFKQNRLPEYYSILFKVNLADSYDFHSVQRCSFRSQIVITKHLQMNLNFIICSIMCTNYRSSYTFLVYPWRNDIGSHNTSLLLQIFPHSKMQQCIKSFIF